MSIELFEKFLATNIINFLIVMSTLVFVFKKAHLGDLINKMADEIKESVEESALDTKNALEEYRAVKHSVKDTKELQEKILYHAKISAQNIKEKTEKKTLLQQEELKSNLQRVFNSQGQKFKNLTVEEVYKASIELAKEEVLKRLNDKTHKKLIDSSIEELDRIEGNLI